MQLYEKNIGASIYTELIYYIFKKNPGFRKKKGEGRVKEMKLYVNTWNFGKPEETWEYGHCS